MPLHKGEVYHDGNLFCQHESCFPICGMKQVCLCLECYRMNLPNPEDAEKVF